MDQNVDPQALDEAAPSVGAAQAVDDGIDPHIAAPPPTIAFQATASLVQPSEAAMAFEEFKGALIRLVDAAGPDRVREDLPNRTIRAITRLIFPFPQDRVLSYESLVASYVALWMPLSRLENQQYSGLALLGTRALSLGRLKTSTQILREVEFQTSTPAALTYVMRGVGAFLRTLFIMAAIFIYPVFLVRSFEGKTIDWNTVLGEQWASVVVAAVCGMLGSVISILLRLSQFETTKGRSQMFLILTGATLPLVGGVFGAFVAALLLAKIISIPAETLSIWVFVVLGFLSGFSERFSRGFMKIAEDRFAGPEASPAAGAPPGETINIAGNLQRPLQARLGG